METTKKQLSKSAMINNALTGLGIYSKATRSANVKAILDNKSKLSGLRIEGSCLKINVTLGFSAEPELLSKLQEVINSHEAKVEETTTGTGQTFLVVDLMKPRN